MWKIVFLNCLLAHLAFSIIIKSTNTDEVSFPAAIAWDAGSNSAYYVDFDADSTDYCLYRYDASEKRTYSAYVKGSSRGTPGFIVPIKSSGPLRKFAVGFESFVGIVYWDGESHSAKVVEELFSVEDRLGPRERLGIGQRDSTGHSLYTGTISFDLCAPPANQTVYVKQKNQENRRVLSNLKTPTGRAFANGYVYILDSCTLKIYAIPDSNCKGACGREQVVFDFKTIGKKLKNFVPLSLESDSNGILYTVNHYDGCIYSIDPLHGKAHLVAKMPMGGITSLAFAGHNGEELYALVASKITDYSTGKDLSYQSPGTSVYRIKGLARASSSKRYIA